VAEDVALRVAKFAVRPVWHCGKCFLRHRCQCICRSNLDVSLASKLLEKYILCFDPTELRLVRLALKICVIHATCNGIGHTTAPGTQTGDFVR
jgi:hypothetical protein